MNLKEQKEKESDLQGQIKKSKGEKKSETFPEKRDPKRSSG